MRYVIADGAIEVEGREDGVYVYMRNTVGGDDLWVRLTAPEVTDLSLAVNQARNKIRKDKS